MKVGIKDNVLWINEEKDGPDQIRQENESVDERFSTDGTYQHVQHLPSLYSPCQMWLMEHLTQRSQYGTCESDWDTRLGIMVGVLC